MVSTGSDSDLVALKSDVSKNEGEFVSQAPQEVKKKRKRVSSACIYCQRSHMSCDESRPCKRCVSRGMSELCRDGKRKRRGRKRKSELLMGDDDYEIDSTNSKESDYEEKIILGKKRRTHRARNINEARQSVTTDPIKSDPNNVDSIQCQTESQIRPPQSEPQTQPQSQPQLQPQPQSRVQQSVLLSQHPSPLPTVALPVYTVPVVEDFGVSYVNYVPVISLSTVDQMNTMWPPLYFPDPRSGLMNFVTNPELTSRDFSPEPFGFGQCQDNL